MLSCSFSLDLTPKLGIDNLDPLVSFLTPGSNWLINNVDRKRSLSEDRFLSAPRVACSVRRHGLVERHEWPGSKPCWKTKTDYFHLKHVKPSCPLDYRMPSFGECECFDADSDSICLPARYIPLIRSVEAFLDRVTLVGTQSGAQWLAPSLSPGWDILSKISNLITDPMRSFVVQKELPSSVFATRQR